MSKAELARKAGVNKVTIDRIEKGMSCRLEIKRKSYWPLDINFLIRIRFFIGLLVTNVFSMDLEGKSERITLNRKRRKRHCRKLTKNSKTGWWSKPQDL